MCDTCVRTAGHSFAGKNGRQTDFTAGEQHGVSKVSCQNGISHQSIGGKIGRHGGAGCFPHLTTLEWDGWAPTSPVVLRM